MDIQVYIPAFVTLFVIIDPIGLTPLFVGLTKGATPGHRRAIALRAPLVAFAVLTAFGLLGEAVLGFLGISMPAFRVAGGLLLFFTAFDMLFERRTQRRKGQSETGLDPADDPSVFPLATPLIAGPGSIAAIILLTGEAGGDWMQLAMMHAVLAAVLGLVVVMFLSAGLLERVLRETGINVLTRLLGMLLAALAVQFVLDGLADFGLAG